MRAMLLPLLVALPAGTTLAADLVEVTETVNIDAPASEAWEAVQDFDGLHTWHPAVAQTEITGGENNVVGAERKLTLGDGGVIMETLESHDADAMSFGYSMGETVLPVADYSATVVVSGDDDSAQVTWSGSFEPTTDDSAAVIGSVYRAGLDNLKSRLESN